MKHRDSRTNKKVLRLCHDINKRADDLEKLQPLVAQLNQVLSQVRYETRTVKVAAQSRGDNPFDKIMVDSGARHYAVCDEGVA